MRQKKKHPRYRNKLCPEQKKSLKRLKDKTKKDQIMNSLYTLPVDIKILIFQMAIISNMCEWRQSLRGKHINTIIEMFGDLMHKFRHKRNDPVINWRRWDGKMMFSDMWITGCNRIGQGENTPLSWEKIDFTEITNKSMCLKNVNKTDQPDIQTIFIPKIN